MAEEGLEREEWREAVSKPVEVAPVRPLSSMVALEVGAASECGKVQPQNTDHYLVVRLGRLQETIVSSLSPADLPPRFEESGYALLVADGLDGADAAGGRASRVALSTLAHLAIRYGNWNIRSGGENAADVIDQLGFLYRQAHDAVRTASRADRRLADMATSLTVVIIIGADLFFAHVGHSRAFIFRNGALIQLTTDHTLEQLQLGTSRPRLLEESKRDQHHLVTETLGGRTNGPEVAIEHLQLCSGDRILLCTNGLTDAVNDEQIADVLASQRHPKEDCRRLIDLALSSGSTDNVTAIVADYSIRSHSDREHAGCGSAASRIG